MRALLIGESWGINELQYKHPFVGRSGQELVRMVGESGLAPPLTITCRNCKQTVPFTYCPCGAYNPVNFLQMVRYWAQTRNSGIGVVNVFNEHPEKDNEELFFGRKDDDVCLDIPPYPVGSKKLYLLKSNRHHLEKLEEDIRSLQPNILIPLGNTACWAVLQQVGIRNIRGAVQNTRFGIKALPTFHPAALRDWSLRPDIITDLRNANQESYSSYITRPRIWLLTHPTLDEIRDWFAVKSQRYAVDIESGTALYSKTETKRMQKYTPKAYNILAQLISIVGFSRSESEGLIIPFMKRDEENGELRSFWSERWQEIRAWEWVQYGLSSGAELVAQNGMYDYNRLILAGMRPKNMKHDDMLLQNALMPERLKGLSYLDTIYRDSRDSGIGPWKMMYGSESLKRDD